MVCGHPQILSDDIWMCRSNIFSKMNIFFSFFCWKPFDSEHGGNEGYVKLLPGWAA